MNKKRVIVIGSDSEFKIKIENLDDFTDSFFRQVYLTAAKNCKEIIDNNIEYYDAKKSTNIFAYKDKEERNNIIAFAGERGAGKTSVMVSFANALKNDKKSDYEGFTDISQNNFWVLDTIDPSLFEKNESVFQVIIAKLFEEFKTGLEKHDNNIRINQQRGILHIFEKVYKNFKTITSDGKNYNSMSLDDTLEALSSLAASSNMRDSFIELIQELLKYKFGNTSLEKHYLVLPIDDLDMNITNAATMAEQIRKYLLIPNVIILMAVKIEQLTDSIEQMFRSEYKTMLDNKILLEDNPKNMAARYIEKLIPNGRKIYLPNFRLIDHLDEISLKYKGNTYAKNITASRKEGIQQEVLGLLYRKIGLIFLKPRKGVHYLIPDNMRELHNLISIFSKLDDIHNVEDNYSICKEKVEMNISTFENYFYNVWIKRNLNTESTSIITALRNEPVENKNKFIIGRIAEVKLTSAQNTKINSSLTLDKFGPSLVPENFNYNISIGDVLDCLKTNKDYDDEETKKLKFAIKTLYSIEIYKNLFIYEDFEEIYKLTAGNVFGEAYSQCIPKNRGEKRINNYDSIIIPIKLHDQNYKFTLERIIEFICPSKDSSNQDRVYKLLENNVYIESSAQTNLIDILSNSD
jgi:hypothetical protein